MIAFGPIPSRRLGKSLGINNIVSHKVCSYGCVYCQIGNTVNKTMVRQAFYEPEKLVDHIEGHLVKLDKKHIPDYLTFVANGEPTLDINLVKEIRLLKKYGFPIAVITNSSLLQHKHVQDDLMEANWVSVKVDTVDEISWRKINRPLVWLDLEKILEGIKTFASAFQGKLCTETMLVEGYNDSPGQLKETASFIALLNPRTAYLSIPTRPPALKQIKPISEEKLTIAWRLFQKNGLKTELLNGFEGTNAGYTGNAFEDIINITAVHPLREDTIAKLLKQDKTDHSVVDSLIAQGLIKGIKYEGKTYYVRNYRF
jgi:wyosine [tRNA(Phe)-imidazoG37] synthetase (radical SAM superfamily)